MLFELLSTFFDCLINKIHFSHCLFHVISLLFKMKGINYQNIQHFSLCFDLCSSSCDQMTKMSYGDLVDLVNIANNINSHENMAADCSTTWLEWCSSLSEAVSPLDYIGFQTVWSWYTLQCELEDA